MDPQACWEDLLEALEANDKEIAIMACRSLISWLAKKGSMPVIRSHDLEFVLGTLIDFMKE